MKLLLEELCNTKRRKPWSQRNKAKNKPQQQYPSFCLQKVKTRCRNGSGWNSVRWKSSDPGWILGMGTGLSFSSADISAAPGLCRGGIALNLPCGAPAILQRDGKRVGGLLLLQPLFQPLFPPLFPLSSAAASPFPLQEQPGAAQPRSPCP